MNYKTLFCFFATFSFLALFGVSAHAFNVPPKPDSGWYVRDMSGKMDTSSIRILNQKIENFNQTKKNEIGILVLPTTDGTAIDDAAHDVFHSWGIGKAGLDNGILIMIASSDRRIRIETGKGAEGDITDVDAKRMINDLRPYLRKNDYAGGLSNTIDSITQLMEDRTGQKPIVNSTSVDSNTQTNAATPTPQTNNEEAASTAAGVVVLMLIGLPASVLFFMWISGFFKKKSSKSYDNYYSYKSPSPLPRLDTYTPPPPPVYVPPRPPSTSTHHKNHTEHKPSYKSSSYSSYKSDDDDTKRSSSYDSSSSSSSSDFGSGFGGGDSGGGGASGDF